MGFAELPWCASSVDKCCAQSQTQGVCHQVQTCNYAKLRGDDGAPNFEFWSACDCSQRKDCLVVDLVQHLCKSSITGSQTAEDAFEPGDVLKTLAEPK